MVISGVLDYSDPQVQKEIDDLLKQLEGTRFIDPTYTESWLRDFLDFVERNQEYYGLNITTEENFISTLENVSFDCLGV